MNKTITSIVLIVIAVGLYFTYTEGAIDAANATRAVNAQYISAIASAEHLISVRDQARTAYNNISAADRANLEKMIPGSVDNIRLIIDLNSRALFRGFSLKNIKAVTSTDTSTTPAPPAPVPVPAGDPSAQVIPAFTTPTLDTVDISFEATASYSQFLTFLQDLEANMRIMDVTHLTVTGSDNGVYTFSVELKTYWLRQ